MYRKGADTTINNHGYSNIDRKHLQGESFAARLKVPGRGEMQRLQDLGVAIDWVTEQLVRRFFPKHVKNTN